MQTLNNSLVDESIFLREAQVIRLLQISRATLARWVSAGSFPSPVMLSDRIKAWRTADVRDWLAKFEPGIARIAP